MTSCKVSLGSRVYLTSIHFKIHQILVDFLDFSLANLATLQFVSLLFNLNENYGLIFTFWNKNNVERLCREQGGCHLKKWPMCPDLSAPLNYTSLSSTEVETKLASVSSSGGQTAFINSAIGGLCPRGIVNRPPAVSSVCVLLGCNWVSNTF